MVNRSYPQSLDDVKKVHADWHGASANGLTSDALAALIEIAEAAGRAWPYCKDASDEPNPKDELAKARGINRRRNRPLASRRG